MWFSFLYLSGVVLENKGGGGSGFDSGWFPGRGLYKESFFGWLFCSYLVVSSIDGEDAEW